MEYKNRLLIGMMKKAYEDEAGNLCEETVKICGSFCEENGSVFFYGAEFFNNKLSSSCKLSEAEFKQNVTNVCELELKLQIGRTWRKNEIH